MTTNLIDIQNSDVIMATSNMAENHPVAFQWVMKAKERGAKLIHVDPRFTRTSAAADVHVPIRSGTNIAFFGGLIAYAIEHDLYFKDYVVHFTNASFLIDPEFKTATDLDGLFTGFDPDKRTYDRTSWKYQLDGEGNPKRDLTLKDPHSVFQLLRRQYSRYTPEMVERVCGIPRSSSRRSPSSSAATPVPRRRGPSPTRSTSPSTPPASRTSGRCACSSSSSAMSGGRAAAWSRSGARQCAGRHRPRAALPRAARVHGDAAARPAPGPQDLPREGNPKGGYWVNKPKFFVSLLKAFFGDAATKDNDFGYDWIPKRAKADAYSHQHIFVDMYNGVIKGFLADGQNPRRRRPNAKLARAAMQKLDWLVVKDIFLTETADIWKAPASSRRT
jgi:formate dehydrogenase major subunit